MTPIELCNTNVFDDHKVVVVVIWLSDEDKRIIYDYHINHDGDPYDIDDVSMLAFIQIGLDGTIADSNYHDICYYPEDYGEHDINKFALPGYVKLEQECIKFIKENYIGHEEDYDI